MAGEIEPGTVIVIRYEGPKGGPGHARDAGDHRRAEGRRPRRRLRARSPTAGSRGGTWGFCIGHVAPEAVDGGPIAFVADGDRIRIDVPKLRSTCSSTTPRSRDARRTGSSPSRATRAACSPSTPSSPKAPKRARSPFDAVVDAVVEQPLFIARRIGPRAGAPSNAWAAGAIHCVLPARAPLDDTTTCAASTINECSGGTIKGGRGAMRERGQRRHRGIAYPQNRRRSTPDRSPVPTCRRP